jgi:hypothetical protein
MAAKGEKENWRDATASLLRIPERHRLIEFVARSGELLFDYYAQRSTAKDPGIAKIALPTSFLERFPLPRGSVIYPKDIDRLKIAVELPDYSDYRMSRATIRTNRSSLI